MRVVSPTSGGGYNGHTTWRLCCVPRADCPPPPKFNHVKESQIPHRCRAFNFKGSVKLCGESRPRSTTPSL